MADADEPKFIQMRSIDDTEGEELKVVGELKVASPARAGHHAVLRGPGRPGRPCISLRRSVLHCPASTEARIARWPHTSQRARVAGACRDSALHPPWPHSLPAPGPPEAWRRRALLSRPWPT